MEIKTRDNKLIIKVDEFLNGSLSNPLILKEVISNMTEDIEKIIIKTNEIIREYDPFLLKGLKKYGISDPIKEFINGKTELKDTSLIKKSEKFIKRGMSSIEIYNELFKPLIKPAFIKSTILDAPFGFKKVKDYSLNKSKVIIFSNGTKFFYYLKPFETMLDYTSLKKITNILKEIRKGELSLTNFNEEVKSIINKKELNKEIKDVVKRYTIGFGVLDLLFNDEDIQDVYIYSIDNTVHVYHVLYGDCSTNIVLSKDEIEAIATKLRVISGRPFDESFPVIDYEYDNIRVCGIREPLTYKGIGYAFRKHRQVPWNIPSFISNKMISPEVSGLVSFLVDGQCSILITGARGSGKTSFLSALITEIPSNQRIIIIEDTPELPVKKLTSAGFKIQHLRIKPGTSRGTAYELSAEEALRTALRLGESVLVIGEVRGEEAKALFEAMRVGATGNVVLGTIHGSTAYDTFDRVVNDLKVPPTSFKSTDIIISCANLRRGESLFTDRRVVSVTEVRKNWIKNPIEENGFKELTTFNRRTNTITLSPHLRESAILKKISVLKGMTINECLKSIKLRGAAKELISSLNVPKDPSSIIKYNDKITELLGNKKRNFLKKFKKFLQGFS